MSAALEALPGEEPLLASAGVDVVRTGVLPTPAVAFLTATRGADLGVMLSASHNPMPDNGIKFFARGGRKLPDEVELAIEEEIDRPFVTVDAAHMGRAERVDDAAGRYIEFCKSTIPSRMESTSSSRSASPS